MLSRAKVAFKLKQGICCWNARRLWIALQALLLQAQQNQSASDSPQAAWSGIQQLVKDLETAVQSKNLHGIHDPSMKIRAPIKTLK